MAYKATAFVEFQKQGKSKGESPRTAHKEKFEIEYFEYQVSSPVNRDSGQSAGRARHGEVMLLKENGPASTQFFHACATEEGVKQMVIDFWSVDKTTGEERVHHTLKLTDGRITSFKWMGDQRVGAIAAAQPGRERSTHELNEIRFSFDSITIEDRVAKAQATWTAQK